MDKTMRTSRVLVAGGGIGGLVTALALNQRGFEVSLYVQAPELHELGAGVTITPNGSRVPCELGLRPAMETITSVLPNRVMRLFNTGETWSLPVIMQKTASAHRFGRFIAGICTRHLQKRWSNARPEPSTLGHAVWVLSKMPMVSP
jgi:2-polyprenyl-6-methoxyphenol hydroxylase-like FAD-dependent oxidoreductase